MSLVQGWTRRTRCALLIATLVTGGLSCSATRNSGQPVMSGSRQAGGPPRAPNRVLLRGVVRSVVGRPVVAATVFAELVNERTGRQETGRCQGQVSLRRDTVTASTGEFEIPIEAVGPQFQACLVLKVLAPSGSGLRDTSLSGHRFWFGLPHAGDTTTVELEVVLMER